jgi:hypothetical protein
MRLRDQTIGALNLFLEGTEPFGRRDLGVARVMADMATIGIIKNWSIRQQENLAQPLQGALTSRVVTQRGRTWGLIGAVQRADPYLPRGRLRRGKGLPSPGCSLA